MTPTSKENPRPLPLPRPRPAILERGLDERLGTNFALFLLSFQPVTIVNMAVEKATVLVTGEAHVMICYQIDRFSHLKIASQRYVY